MTDNKEIRKQLKEKLGYNSRQVTVARPYWGKIVFTVRDPSVDFDAVEEFAKTFEVIHWDKYANEILSGGNTFVDVCRSGDVERYLIEKNLPAVTAAAERITGRNIVPIDGTDSMIGRGTFDSGYSIWRGDEKVGEAYNLRYAAMMV